MSVPKTLSIIIPAYNEERFIGDLLKKVVAQDLRPLGLQKEIIVIDDGSKDRTVEIVNRIEEVSLLKLEQNSGKGSAIRRGIRQASGDYILIQDADLEYDPSDYGAMLEVLVQSEAEAVYGSRYLPDASLGAVARFYAAKYKQQSWPAYLGGRSLSLVAMAMTGRLLTDTVTALKLFRADILKSLQLETTGFETDHEITAKLLARRCKILEVPISYYPRSREEGKKIGFRDWFIACKTYLLYRRG